MRIIKKLPVRAHQYRVEKIDDHCRYFYYYVPGGVRAYVMAVDLRKCTRNGYKPIGGVVISYAINELSQEQREFNID